MTMLPWDTKSKKKRRRTKGAKKKQRWLQILTVSSALLFAVANGEVMQGIAHGTFSSSATAYNKPAFLSWSAYNCFLLSWIPLKLCCRRLHNCSVSDFLQTQWASSGSMRRMLAWSFVMQLLLLCINILWVIGLTHDVSVSTSNAIYQLQTGVTVGLSVIWLKHRFVVAEALGIGLSLIGVAIIVVPPLLSSDDNTNESSKDGVVGECATLVSAVLWGFYQVTWQVIGKREASGLEGLMDTLATLGVMGAVNLIIGCPLLFLLHWTGLELFEVPHESSLFSALVVNGLVEYAFDASCALSIYLTSPVVTAITAPLTIPLSMVWDGNVGNQNDWAGSVLVVLGVLWMELRKPKAHNVVEYSSLTPEVMV